MTLEFECEMAKCHDELQKAQNTNLKYYRIVERREKQISELREAVGKYLDLVESVKAWEPPTSEFRQSVNQAYDKLRAMICTQ